MILPIIDILMVILIITKMSQMRGMKMNKYVVGYLLTILILHIDTCIFSQKTPRFPDNTINKIEC